MFWVWRRLRTLFIEVNDNPGNLLDPFGLESQGTDYVGIGKELLSYVTFVGNAISLYDAVGYFNRGDIKNGLMYSAFVIPGAGNVAKAGKGIVKGAKYFPYGIDKLDGVRIMNKKYAGTTPDFTSQVLKKYPGIAKKYPKAVSYDSYGFPDFSGYSKKTVKVDGLTGKPSDFTKANKEAGYARKPEGFTWHHVEDGVTMMLVPSDIHEAFRHTGGANLIKKGIVP